MHLLINLFGTPHGKLGLYYINTHFLYGSEKDALDLLNFIDAEKSDKENLPYKIYQKVTNQYNSNSIYKSVIDEMIDFITKNIDLASIDYISGGERRDWFFSNIIANKLGKPHISIYKDLTVVVHDSSFEKLIDNSNLQGANVLHIADLITEASSYVRAWIPAISSLGAKILYSFVVVDRLQGGKEVLSNNNVQSFALLNIDENLFIDALRLNIITDEQFEMLKKFKNAPDETMRKFLLEHPNFLDDALKSDEKTASRAKLCIDNDLYNLKKE